MRVLVWNLFHGRADPPAGRPLLHEFAEALADWEWDVALLQEVPPWWPPLLAHRCDAEWRTALTSRNQVLPLRRAVASRAPDRLKSNGGGANAILVRTPGPITVHGQARLRIRPERRVVHAVRVAYAGGARGQREAGGDFDGAWFGNVHTHLGHWDDAAGMAAPLGDLQRATAQLEAWSGRSPIVLGGDFNLPRATVGASLPHGWTRIASSGPDHVAGRGVVAVSPSQRPDRGTLSDHAPLLVNVAVC